jgi:hypothetical protein
LKDIYLHLGKVAGRTVAFVEGEPVLLFGHRVVDGAPEHVNSMEQGLVCDVVALIRTLRNPKLWV